MPLTRRPWLPLATRSKSVGFLRDFRVIFCWSQWAETLERVEKEGMVLRPQGGAS